jgi:hypothetical protein
MRNLVAGLVVAVGVACAGPALALSQWWTPTGIQCPTFDSEDACEQFCARDQKLCGGSTQCAFATGSERPMCAVPLGSWTVQGDGDAEEE